MMGMLCGCPQSRQSSKKDGKMYVVATTGMLADAAKVIGGPHVRVDGLMGPGVDPHLYKATAADTRRLATADLILYNGLHLEGKMQGLLKKMARRRHVVACTDNIPKKSLRKPPSFQGYHDPHVWFDVSLWQFVVRRIGEAFAKADKAHAKEYRKRAKAYEEKLIALHKWVKTQVSSIPTSQRILVTSHDAFGYFGQAYGVKVVGIQGISTVAEAGVKDVERVVDLIMKSKLKAIFVESSVSEKSLKAVMQACAARGHVVKIGGSLFSDAMGAEGTVEGTYLGMVRHNVKTLKRALASDKK
tara:strand:+ start:4876 stop:5778 length:903 start_codon:yes stop_codon:yes gene_type:complete